MYPEDVENALRVAGIRDSVAIETRPGRIEAVVLAPTTPALGPTAPGSAATPGDTRARRRSGAAPAAVTAQIDAAVKRANAALGPNQRIAGWRLWPEADFPRTHTFKVKRDRVRTWASIEDPLPVSGVMWPDRLSWRLRGCQELRRLHLAPAGAEADRTPGQRGAGPPPTRATDIDGRRDAAASAHGHAVLDAQLHAKGSAGMGAAIVRLPHASPARPASAGRARRG